MTQYNELGASVILDSMATIFFNLSRYPMTYLIVVYVAFLIIFAYFSVIGIAYLKAGGRGTNASSRAISWYLWLSITVIVLSIIALGLEYYLIP